MDIVSSSNNPSGLIFDLFANSNIVGVGWMLRMLSSLIICKVITFMAAPKSMGVYGMYVPLMHTVTIGFPGSSYLSIRIRLLVDLQTAQ